MDVSNDVSLNEMGSSLEVDDCHDCFSQPFGQLR